MIKGFLSGFKNDCVNAKTILRTFAIPGIQGPKPVGPTTRLSGPIDP